MAAMQHNEDYEIVRREMRWEIGHHASYGKYNTIALGRVPDACFSNFRGSRKLLEKFRV